MAQQPLLLERGPRLRGFAHAFYHRAKRKGAAMGIQDRDYWRDRYKAQSSEPTASFVHPPRKVYSSSDSEIEKPTPKIQGFFVHRWAWILLMFWGFILGKNWERIKFLGDLFYQKYIAVLF